MSRHKKDSILKISSYTDMTFMHALRRLDRSMRRFQAKQNSKDLYSMSKKKRRIAFQNKITGTQSTDIYGENIYQLKNQSFILNQNMAEASKNIGEISNDNRDQSGNLNSDIFSAHISHHK